jgi:hypothetical protein
VSKHFFNGKEKPDKDDILKGTFTSKKFVRFHVMYIRFDYLKSDFSVPEFAVFLAKKMTSKSNVSTVSNSTITLTESK